MKKTIIFAHRGYPVKFAENSLEGFRYVVSHGGEGVEFDVHLTKDGVPVVMHDEKIDRTTDGKGYIKDYTLAEIRKFHLANGEPVPKLSELFDVLQDKDIYINLEFKTNKVHDQGIEKTVLDLAKKYHFVHPIIFSSFNYETLKIAQKLDADEEYCYLVKGLKHPAEIAKKNHFAGIHPEHYLRSSQPVTERIWTVDNSWLAKHYCKLGVAGLFTNDYKKIMRIRDEVQK